MWKGSEGDRQSGIVSMRVEKRACRAGSRPFGHMVASCPHVTYNAGLLNIVDLPRFASAVTGKGPCKLRIDIASGCKCRNFFIVN